MSRILLVAVVSGALLSGCGVLPRPCTEIGCSSGVTFVLGDKEESLFPLGQPVEVRACIGENCVTETLTVLERSAEHLVGGMSEHLMIGLDGTLRYDRGQEDFGDGAKTVSLQLRHDSTVVLEESRDGVTFGRFQPNGEGCEPVCSTSSITL